MDNYMEQSIPPAEGEATLSSAYTEQITETEAKVIRKIKRITDRGNNAEVRKKKDGSLTVYEVRKNIV